MGVDVNVKRQNFQINKTRFRSQYLKDKVQIEQKLNNIFTLLSLKDNFQKADNEILRQ